MCHATIPRYGMDMAQTRIKHIESEVYDTIQHNMLLILKYLGIKGATSKLVTVWKCASAYETVLSKHF